MITDTEQVKPFNTDWTKKFIGESKLVLRPSTTDEVSKVLKYCNDRRLAVVP